MTREDVIKKLGITEDLNDKKVNELIDKVCEISNILGDVEFTFRENATEVIESGKVIASVSNVVFWFK